jgi:hypothetical protein
MVAEARGQFESPEERECPALRAVTEQRLVMTEKTCGYIVVAVIIGVCKSVRVP